MFTGALPGPLAAYIAKNLRLLGLPVVVACSGNFTVERALVGSGLDVASNYISLYTSAIGRAVVAPSDPPLARPFEGWLSPFCDTAEDLATTLLVLSGNYMGG